MVECYTAFHLTHVDGMKALRSEHDRIYDDSGSFEKEMPCELTVCIAREKSPVRDKNILRAFIYEKYTLLHTQFSNLSRNRRVFVQTALRAFVLEK